MIDENPKVMIGIMTWNQKEDTLRCLESLRAVTSPHPRVVVLDNASTDGTLEAIRKGYSEVEILPQEINCGCAGGRNHLLRYFLKTTDTYLLLLDNDTIVFGEVGLSGEIRPIPNGQDRLREAVKHGFKRAIVPKANIPKNGIDGLEIIAVQRLDEALGHL